MGKKLDSLFGRNYKPAKLKPLLDLAVVRITILRKQRQTRTSLARSDVVQILHLGHHDRALLRVEQVIKEQNMLDVFVMIEGYCNLLEERINLIEQERVCPDELKEAMSSLIYASTRCGDFPELQEMRTIFTAQYGKDFVARAIELRNNCGVNLKIIQKLSTRQPNLESRLKVLMEIASENNIVLKTEEISTMTAEEKLETEQKQQTKPELSSNSGGFKSGGNSHNLSEEIESMDCFSDSMNGARKYKDVADAAQAAFKSAAYAAAAARAAVELSRSESHDPDDESGPGPRKRKETDEHDTDKSEHQTIKENSWRRVEDKNVEMGSERVHPIQNYDSDESEDDEIHEEKRAEETEDEEIHGEKRAEESDESEDEEIHGEKRAEESDESEDEEIYEEKIAEESDQSKTAMPGFDSDLDDDDDDSKGTGMPLEVGSEIRSMEKGMNFDEIDNDTGNEQSGALLSGTHDLGLDMKPSLIMNEGLDSMKSNSIVDEDFSERDGAKVDQSQKRFSLRSHIRKKFRAWKS